MRFEPYQKGVDDGTIHLSRHRGMWWLYEWDGDMADAHARRNGMQTAPRIISDTIVDLENNR